jgi:UDP-N-acetylmuramoyl-tripeptide--D-alanyl-D-alanine ligase
MAIIEMGANHQQEIAFYCGIAEPDFALINNCGKAHLEGFGGEEGVRKGKGELYDFIRKNQGCIFRNVDLAYLETMSTGIEKQITYGSRAADYTGIAEIQNDKLWVHITSPGMECSIPTHLVGDYNFGNVMAAVAVGRCFEVPIQEIQFAITSYTPNNSRSQQIQQGTNTIILDAYNANPSSMSVAIESFATIDGRKSFFLGDMLELGDHSQSEHKQIFDLCCSLGIEETTYLVGPEFFEACPQHPYRFETMDALLAWLDTHPIETSFAFVKGSRGIKMERVIEHFLPA